MLIRLLQTCFILNSLYSNLYTGKNAQNTKNVRKHKLKAKGSNTEIRIILMLQFYELKCKKNTMRYYFTPTKKGCFQKAINTMLVRDVINIDIIVWNRINISQNNEHVNNFVMQQPGCWVDIQGKWNHRLKETSVCPCSS